MTAAPLALSTRARPRRGFALITALVLLGLVVTLLVTMTSQLQMQIRRDSSAAKEAQLRELLLAGQTAARQTLDSTSEARYQLPVPPELADGKATITCTRDAAHPDQVLVQATLAGQSRQQRLYYRHGPNGWQLDDAILNPE